MTKNNFRNRPAAIASRAVGLFAGILAFTCFGTGAALAQNYNFTTLVGNASALDHIDGTGTNARLLNPTGIAVDGAGNIYVADGGDHTVRKANTSGVVTTLAGASGQVGSSDGTGTNARFIYPYAIAVDTAGNVYVTDIGNHNIRKITAGGSVSTLAGTAGIAGSVDGTGTAAQFNLPQGIAVDAVGNVYVSDTNNSTIRKIAPGNVVTTLAGSAGQTGADDGTGAAARFNYPFGLAVDSAGNIYAADYGNSVIRKITAVGTVTTFAGSAPQSGSTDGSGSAARFDHPSSVAVDASGNVYVMDTSNQTVRKISAGGSVSTLAGSPGFGGRTDGTGAAAKFFYPAGITVTGNGTVYVADTGNHTLRTVTAAGAVATLAGGTGLAGIADGVGGEALFRYPYGVAIDVSGNLYIADHDNHTIRQMTAAGAVTTLAGSAGLPGAADGTGGAARFRGPTGVAVDAAGNVFVSDAENSAIRKIAPGGVVTTFAGSLGSAGSADGVGTAARFNAPQGLALDSFGNVYVADTKNNTVRKITASGAVTTIGGVAGQTGTGDGPSGANRFNAPYAVAVDSAGNVYVADFFNATIRKITPSGTVSTLAGLPGQVGLVDGTGGAARFNQPYGVAVDGSGNVFVTDTYNRVVRKITAAGAVTTISGASTRFYYAEGIALDGAGNLYVVDGDNQAISKGVPVVPPPSGTVVASQSVAAGQNATFTLGAAVAGTSYRWQVSTDAGATWTAVSDGASYSGSSSVTLTVLGATSAMNGYRYNAVQSNSAGTATSGAGTLTVTATVPPGPGADGTVRLVNIATRAYCATGNNVTIGGFVISGSVSKRVLVRAVGPSLTAQGIGASEVLADPAIEVHSSSAIVAANDNWGDNTNVAEIATVGAQIGANPLLASDTKSAALLVTLAPGVYSFIISGKNNSSGVVLLEVYDADAGTPASTFVNIATRAYSTTGNGVTIGGFVIAGTGSKQVLVRAMGPTLMSQGLGAGEILSDPMIELHSGSAIIASNDNWGESTNAAAILSTGARIGATPFAADDTKSAALLMRLAPGVYSFIASGKGGASGIVLVEVYDAD